MIADYRQALLGIHLRLNPNIADAEWTLTQTADAEISVITKELRELNFEMQARVEAKLEQ